MALARGISGCISLGARACVAFAVLFALPPAVLGSEESSDAPAGSAANPVFIAPSDSTVLLEWSDSTATYVAPVHEVQAQRLSRPQQVDRDAGFASVIEASSWGGGIQSAASVLSRAVGVTVRDTGGLGSYSALSVRGSTSAQVPVYLDGVPISNAQTGAVNLADIPLGALERIEVYRGAAPLILGGGSLGGAVHLISDPNYHRPWLKVAAGSYRTFAAEAGGGLRTGRWTLRARGRAVSSQGDWNWLFHNRTPYNPRDDYITTRRNNDVSGGGASLSLRGSVGAWNVGVSEILDFRQSGIPGRDLQAQFARGRNLTHQFRIMASPTQSSSGWIRQLELYHRYDGQGFDDRDGELGLGHVERDDGTHAIGTNLIGGIGAGRRPSWRLEGRWARLQSHLSYPIEEDGAAQTRFTGAAAFQPELRFLHGRLLLTPGARVEVHDDRHHGVPPFGALGLPGGPSQHGQTWAHTYQMGGRLRVSRNLILKANVGVYDRVPTLLERFGHRGTVIGNPNLLPENGVNRDVGFIWSEPQHGTRLMVSVFHNDSSNLIVFVRNSQQTSIPTNVGAAEVRGLEVDADLGQWGAIGSAMRMTWLETQDKSGIAAYHGQPLPGRPGYEMFFRLSWFSRRLQARYEMTAMGDNTLQRSGRERIPSRLLHTIAFQVPVAGVAVDARVDNLTDETQLFDLYGWPLPGRTFTLSLRMGGGYAR